MLVAANTPNLNGGVSGRHSWGRVASGNWGLPWLEPTRASPLQILRVVSACPHWEVANVRALPSVGTAGTRASQGPAGYLIGAGLHAA